MNRRRFIGSCACCAFASCAAALFNKDKMSGYNHEARTDFIYHIEVQINEHCNIGCKYCNHYSSVAEEEYYDLDKFEQDIKQMSLAFEERLADLHLLGGEPLLNPNINEYIKISRKYFSTTHLSIVTNAILLDYMDKSFWKTCSENNVNILPSIYPIKINWESVFEKAEKYNIGIYGCRDFAEKLTLKNIKKYRKDVFSKVKLKEDKYTDDLGDFECEIKFECPNMFDGKLYPCCLIAYIRHLNKRFGTNFKVTENDYIDLYKVQNLAEAQKLIKNLKPDFCKYCMHKIKPAKWENSKEHSLSEWT